MVFVGPPLDFPGSAKNMSGLKIMPSWASNTREWNSNIIFQVIDNVISSRPLPWAHTALAPDLAAKTSMEMWGKEGQYSNNFSWQTYNTMDERTSCNHELCQNHNIEVDLWKEIRSFPILPHPIYWLWVSRCLQVLMTVTGLASFHSQGSRRLR